MTRSIKELDAYTPEQINEFGICLSDPVYFINTYLFELRPEQAEEVKKYHTNKEVTTDWNRQTGKSSIAAAYLLYHVIFNIDQNALIVGPIRAVSQYDMDLFYAFYDKLPVWLRPRMTRRTKQCCEFEHGSRVSSAVMSENTGKGMTVNYLWIDEPLFASSSRLLVFWESLMPTLYHRNNKKIIITKSEL